MTRQKATIPLDEKEKHDRISVLSTHISNLEDKVKELDTIIVNRENAIEKYKENQQILDGIISHIDDKTAFRDALTNEIDILVSQKTSLSKETQSLNISIEEKKKYIEDIEVLKKNITILQEDMRSFQDSHSENKKKLSNEIDSIKSKLHDLHSNLGLLLAKV